MQPYVNPNYFQQPMMNYQQPYNVQPYMDRLAQLQQQVQAIQQPAQQQIQQPMILNGKMVDSLDVVKATDIPMDGNMYYFPKADGTEVYAKHWLPTGNTEIVTYKPYFEQKETKANISPTETEKLKFDPSDEFTRGISEQFDKLNDRLSEIEKKITLQTQRKTSQTQKLKEADSE